MLLLSRQVQAAVLIKHHTTMSLLRRRMMMTKKPSGGEVTLQSSFGDNAHNAAIYAEFRTFEAGGGNILDAYTIIVDGNIIVADIWFVEDFYSMHDSEMEISITLRSNGMLIVSYV